MRLRIRMRRIKRRGGERGGEGRGGGEEEEGRLRGNDLDSDGPEPLATVAANNVLYVNLVLVLGSLREGDVALHNGGEGSRGGGGRKGGEGREGGKGGGGGGGGD
ncbi:hypothetical protein HZH68_009442 [Vespula germanica]|uniref:Uncharacterized protein n=1 Tax=Vespula germanica TaxID=30212 RepID=A0A834JVZ2_VESGE|nr:hypothetical protein HZH68_009442 [Vespula germanica]